MKRYKDIEDLYKEMFSDYNPEPPAQVWENIQAVTRARKKSSLWKKITFPVAGIIVVSTIVYLLVVNLQPEEVVVTAMNDKKQLEQPDIPAEKTITEDVSEASISTNFSASQQSGSADHSLETEMQTSGHVQNNHHSVNDNSAETQTAVVSHQFVPVDKKDTTVEMKTPPIKHVQEQHTPKVIQNKHQQKKIARISKDTTVCENTAVQLYAYNVENVRWSTGETQNLITVYPSYEEQYSLTFTTENKKDTTVYIHVRVNECPDIYVPNAFTPNGDGLNDIFYVKTKMELTFFELTIYASNGRELLFTSKNINQGWDGTYRGHLQAHGLYFYTVRYTDKFGKNTEKRGELLLIAQ
ncbi:MAG: gliding motility-associated C-terminal domain-containing protein [Bacteroidales bacterium]|jgi:gliding motility-associated-like protein|nr:gliding motility-associated C-terminal domain-containing protein [Bacteroidales bacterium]